MNFKPFSGQKTRFGCELRTTDTLEESSAWVLGYAKGLLPYLSAHKVNGIREAIKAVGATIIYLSLYSPDCSPIENCWLEVKEFLRKRATRTYAHLD